MLEKACSTSGVLRDLSTNQVTLLACENWNTWAGERKITEAKRERALKVTGIGQQCLMI